MYVCTCINPVYATKFILVTIRTKKRSITLFHEYACFLLVAGLVSERIQVLKLHWFQDRSEIESTNLSSVDTGIQLTEVLFKVTSYILDSHKTQSEGMKLAQVQFMPTN